VELVEQLRRANARLREALVARDGEVEALRVVSLATVMGPGRCHDLGTT